MIQVDWKSKKSNNKISCINNEAKRYKVNSMLTVGKEYEVVNETDEFIFIIDNSGRVGGYYKEYFDLN